MINNEELRKELEEFRKETENLKKVLERKIKSCDRVVIIPHNFADMDAIGSAIGLSLIATHFNKPYTIIDNDPSHLIEAGVKKIINECDGKYEIITKDKYMKKRGNRELYILTDVNKTDLICVKDILPSEDHIVIIDHHEPDDTTVKATQKFINPKRSSASEMVTDLLKTMEIDIPSDVATYLYSGIFLDTVRLSKPKSRLALHIAADLKDYGADTNRVNDYFKEDLESYLKVHESIKNIKIHSCMLAIIKTNEDIVYTKEELSKIADEAMVLGADASFAIGVRNDNTIGISARSTGNIDINAIMEKFGGGGHDTSGAATITDSTIEEVYNKLEKVLKPSYYKER